MSRYLIIVNPIAGRGLAGRSIDHIESELRTHKLDFSIVKTERPWHAAELAENGVKDGYDVIVSVSGDGTANEVLNGCMRAKKSGYSQVSMGMIAVGTGNDFAFGMGIPGGVDVGCRILAENHRRLTDVGVIKGGDYPDGRYFGNGVGIGFDAATGFVAAKIRWTRGVLLYLLAAIETAFIFYKPPVVRLFFDDQELTQASLMISIMNGRRMGGGFYFAPNGDPADGKFDLCIAASPSRARIFGLFPYFMKGTQATQKEVIMRQARKVRAQALEGKMPIHADGETIAYEAEDVEVELLPAQIEFVTQKPA